METITLGSEEINILQRVLTHVLEEIHNYDPSNVEDDRIVSNILKKVTK